jgi:hypothetical protein
VVDEPDVTLPISSEPVPFLKVDKEISPYLDKSIGDIHPQSLDANVVDALSIYVRASIRTAKRLHVLSNTDILSPVITTDTTRNAMRSSCLKEKFQDGASSIVVADTNGRDKPRVAINEAVHNHFPSNEIYCG